MGLSQRLKKLREERRLSQLELAEQLGVTKTTISNWERGAMIPNINYASKIAAFFHVTVDELLNEKEQFVSQAYEEYGPMGKRQAEQLIEQAYALFFSGDVPDEDKDAVLRAITESYFDAKEKSKKFTPKKYLPHKE